MKNIVLESELSRIKEVMGLQTINEASEVNAQNSQLKNLVAELIKKNPEIKNVCSVKDINQSEIDNIYMKHLTKIFGNKTNEFITKFKTKINSLDNSDILQLISKLKGYLTRPKEGAEFIKQMVGMDDKEQVSEQIITIIFWTFMLSYTLISLILLLLGKGNFGSFVGCSRSF